MTVYDKTEELLGSLFNSYFHGFPDFGKGQEPDTYVVYTALHRPEHYVSGRKTADSYLLTLEVFTPSFSPELYDEIEALFTEQGFLYQGGREIEQEGEFPQQSRYSMDFLVYMDTKDT